MMTHYGSAMIAINAAKLEDERLRKWEERLRKWKEQGGPVPLPQRLSLLTWHKDYRPDYARVGVKLNGEERKDVEWYDVEARELKTVHKQKLYGTIEVFWRYPETRQQRRARERWEAKR